MRFGNNKTCTSKKQQWDVRISKKREKIHKPCKISSIIFSRPHPENDDCEPGHSRKNYESRSRADIDVKFTAEDWEAVAEATNGTASVLQFKKTKFCTEVDFLVSTLSPSTVADIVCSSDIKLFHPSLKNARTECDINNIKTMTEDQALSENWYHYRHGVITASVAHEVLCKDKSDHTITNMNSSNNLCAKICGQSNNITSSSLSWGRSNEKYAIKRYIRKTKHLHKNFTCKPAGLFIHSDYPFLGATPDSLIDYSCCGFGLLECKCPFSARDKNISEYLTSPGCVIHEKDHTYELKPNHPYYTQVQHQMFVTGTSYCDFEVYLPKESCTFRVKIDPDYLQHCVPKLITYFNSIVLPYLYNIDDIEISTTCKNIINNLLKKVEENVNHQVIINELLQLSTFNQSFPALPYPCKRKLISSSNAS